MSDASRPHPVLLWGSVLLMTVFWTLNTIAGKFALEGFAPFLLVAVRTSFAAGFILIALLFRRPQGPILARDWPGLLALGGLQIGNQIFFITGLEYTSVAHTTLIFAMVPVLVLLMAASVGQERVTRRKLLGMGVCVAGVALLTQDQGEGRSATLFGDTLIAGATVLFSSFSVLGKSKRERYGPIVMNAVAYCTSAIVLQPVIWIVYREASLLDAPPSAWAGMLFMASMSAVVGYLIYFWALGYTSASKIAVFQYLQAPLATMLSAIFLDEPVSLTLGVSGLLILSGVYLTERG